MNNQHPTAANGIAGRPVRVHSRRWEKVIAAVCPGGLALITGWCLIQGAVHEVHAQPASTNAPPANRTDAQVMVISTNGLVEVLRAGAQTWDLASVEPPRNVLHPGDQLRTGPQGRALIQLADHTQDPMGPNSRMRVLPGKENESWLDLLKGRFFFNHRDRPGSIRVRTPTVDAAIRGTDFSVEVLEEAAGLTRIHVFDGAVEMTNAMGKLNLASGQAGEVQAGEAPRPIPMIEAVNVIQWCLYYPVVLVPEELEFDEETKRVLDASLRAYAAGDLQAALANYPEDRRSASHAETVYLAALWLSVGELERTQELLAAVPGREWGLPSVQAAAALARLVAAVKHQESPACLEGLATTALAESYYQQSRSDLIAARASARAAVELAPAFGPAWARVAELEFAFGRHEQARRDLARALELSPRHAQARALRGFLLAARNETRAALREFDQAIALNGRLGNAWLGRGLCLIRSGHPEEGLRDIQAAAALEPRRAILRSYLGKSFAETGQRALAEHELELAKEMDPNDPTSRLYLALLHQSQNRINEAVRELEASQRRNDNRSVFRSRHLLDQDQAVRGANLAAIYRDAGMREVAFREAVRAVHADYANYSAHLFLANSYNQLRDPNQFTLRYETPWLSEYLMANLLAPVGAGTLSQTVSQEEYSRLFERDRRAGLVSRTEYSSNGDWTQGAAHYGRFDDFSYALDAGYRFRNGWRPNNDLEQLSLTLQLKHQITPDDGLFVQAGYYDAEGGDLAPVYDPGNPGMINRRVRVRENQEPLLIAGYHHAWSPRSHTLLLAGRLHDEVRVSNPTQNLLTLGRDPDGTVNDVIPTAIAQDYRSDLVIYTAEAQHILQFEPHTFIAGGRFQAGEFDTRNRHGAATFNGLPALAASILQSQLNVLPPDDVSPDMNRSSVYLYDQWELLPDFLVVGGVSYDRLTYPDNHRYSPLQSDEEDKDKVSPKAGFVWTPWERTTLRGAFARGLGGVSFDQSFQLEPTQVAGFNQAWRSVIPETAAGSNAGEEFETWGLSLEQKVGRGTYLGLSGTWLRSDVKRAFGVYDVDTSTLTLTPGETTQDLEYEERSAAFTVNQLLGDEWAWGAGYRISQAELEDRFVEVPVSANLRAGAQPRRDLESVLHTVNLFLLYAHPSGFFGRGEALWHGQSNHGYTPDRPGDDFWQFNVHAGYRFPGRRAEIRLGVLNLADRDYRLNPLNLYGELPRERTYTASLAFWF